jgi:hypothetical protein
MINKQCVEDIVALIEHLTGKRPSPQTIAACRKKLDAANAAPSK